jgi:hypothetical protein
MTGNRCPQCEQHAELHRGNWGFGDQSKRCEPCEDHANNGCPDRRKKQSRWW